MTEELKLDLMKEFKKLNVAEYTTKYGDYYGLMFAGAEIATKKLEKELAELKADNDARKFAMAMSEKVEGKLQKENAELEAQIEKMKNCRNCKNEKIEGACGHFTQVGRCKNWELTE